MEETDEIDVTPEMIEAGLKVLSLYDQANDSAEFTSELIEEIYSAMRRSRRS